VNTTGKTDYVHTARKIMAAKARKGTSCPTNSYRRLPYTGPTAITQNITKIMEKVKHYMLLSTNE
jgi:hypothetical protein